MPRMTDLMLKSSIIGQHQQALAVSVETSRRIDTGNRYKVGKRGTTLRVCESTQHTIGLVQEQDSSHDPS
jgi:hypothetical protein